MSIFMNSNKLDVLQFKNQVEECLQGVQQELDFSFERVNAALNELSSVTYLSILQQTVNDQPKFDEALFFSKEMFADQLIQEIQQISNLSIQQKPLQNQNLLIQSEQSDTKEIDQQLRSILQQNHDKSISKPFNYDLIQNHSIYQSESCRAIAINNDNTKLLAGCSNKIKVFEFKQEQLKQIQLLSLHQNDVTTLNFMKKQTQFISGSRDKTIIIWSMDEDGQWICSQILYEHKDWIRCQILNINEDLIISGSCDTTIKFWIKQNQWVSSQTIIDHKKDIFGLSLNENQNRVISCGLDNLILIMEQSLLKWNIIQKIRIEHYGFRLCFINDYIFTFQPFCKEYMHVYEINSDHNQYIKTREILIKCDSISCNIQFPQQYIKSKYLIVNKNGKYVNLIRKNQNGNFTLQKSIEFQSSDLFGLMSENGEYLITWENKSKEIQIRKFYQYEE